MRSTTRPSGPTTTWLRPACRRRARPTAAAAMASSSAYSASVVGRKPGSACRTSAAAVRSSSSARPDGRGGRPPHAEVALDGPGHGRGGDDLAGEGRLLGVELDHRVHVGGGAAHVDDDDVAGTRRSRARQHLDAGEHHVGRRAGDHRGEVCPLAEVLAADHVGQEHLPDRRAGRVRGEHADAGHHVVGDDVRVVPRAPPRPRAGRRRCPRPRRVRSSRPATMPRAASTITCGVAAVRPARQQHHVRSGRRAPAAPERSSGPDPRRRRPRPPGLRWRGRPGGRPRR